MLYCLNPKCSNPVNPDNHKFCHACGSQLILRNRYRILKPLGNGGFGKTYIAEDTDCMNAVCVIKQFSPSSEIQANTFVLQKAEELFNQEAARLLQLGEHPQIPRLLAYFEENKRLYLVQEFVDGDTLLTELHQQGAFNEEKIRQILADLLPVLKIVHEYGVIHRDIKPDNIMRRHKDGKIMLIDFGVSKQVTGKSIGQSGTTVGTPGYVPLEQLRGQVYPASDLYSLGVTCISLLTNCLPDIEGNTQLYDPTETAWIWRNFLPAGINVSRNLALVLDKLLQERVKDRYQSANEVIETLRDDLSSDRSIDYKTLRDLLANEQWKLGENETIQVMLKVACRENEGWLRKQDKDNFPAVDFRTIDTLWVKYSNGRFAKQAGDLLQSITDDLSSVVAVDYTKLRNYLAAGNWREADAETVNVMLQAAGRKAEGWIDLSSIKKFPCVDLQTIDSLWVKYSNGKFGFSVQKKIWESVGGSPNADGKIYKVFCDRIGWYEKGDLFFYSNLIFDISAPNGHLPSGRAGDIALLIRLVGKFGGFGVERVCAIVAKLQECGI